MLPREMMPFEPEKLEALRARFPKALLRLWYVDHAPLPGEPAPYNTREHVFDFEDGLRLIISKDRDAGGEPRHDIVGHIHVSASVIPGTMMLEWCKREYMKHAHVFFTETWPHKVKERFDELARDAIAQQSMFMSFYSDGKGCLHLMLEPATAGGPRAPQGPR